MDLKEESYLFRRAADEIKRLKEENETIRMRLTVYDDMMLLFKGRVPDPSGLFSVGPDLIYQLNIAADQAIADLEKYVAEDRDQVASDLEKHIIEEQENTLRKTTNVGNYHGATKVMQETLFEVQCKLKMLEVEGETTSEEYKKLCKELQALDKLLNWQDDEEIEKQEDDLHRSVRVSLETVEHHIRHLKSIGAEATDQCIALIDKRNLLERILTL